MPVELCGCLTCVSQVVRSFNEGSHGQSACIAAGCRVDCPWVLLGCGLADCLGMLGHSHAAVKDGDKKDKKDLKPVEGGMKVGWPLDRPCSSLSS